MTEACHHVNHLTNSKPDKQVQIQKIKFYYHKASTAFDFYRGLLIGKLFTDLPRLEYCVVSDTGNGRTLHDPGLYSVPTNVNGVRTNIKHLFALEGDILLLKF